MGDWWEDSAAIRNKVESLKLSDNIKTMDEWNTIAGHNCRKAVFLSEGNRVEVWLSNDTSGGGSWVDLLGEI